MTAEIIMHSFPVTSANIAINNISLKTRFFGLHFCCKQYRSTFNHSDVIGSKSLLIRRNNAKYGPLRQCGFTAGFEFDRS